MALASHVLARRSAGVYVVRVEDLDPPRVVAGSAARILDDLAWLGLGSDEPVMHQSTRHDAYADALGRLEAEGLVYPCDCSRVEIQRAASAPHAGEETRYPGTCRDEDPKRSMRRPPALRLRVPSGELGFEDLAAGSFSQDLARDVGDFVLRRGDGVYAYQLAVAVDDLAQGITHVVRGLDLLASTPRQLHLMKLLGAARLPAYAHVPMVVDARGERLAKRSRGARVCALRAAGVPVEEVLGALAFGIGLRDDPSPCALAALASGPSRFAWRRTAWRIPESWAASDPIDPGH